MYIKLKKYLQQKRTINSFDITLLLKQLATLMEAGIPIDRALNILEKGQEKMATRLLLFNIKRELLTGKSLSQCLALNGHYFDAVTCQLIKVGEATGRVENMLTTIAAYKEKHLLFKKKIKCALFYPCIILSTAFLVILIMIFFIIPKFQELFSDINNELPLLTQWIFNFSQILQTFFWPFLFITSINIILLVYYRQAILKRLQIFIFKLPIINIFLRKIVFARFSRNLALTFTAGLPITQALQLSTLSCSNYGADLQQTFITLQRQIHTGRSLSQAMAVTSFFPMLMLQMIKVGEESGELPPMLNKIADFFETDINQIAEYFGQLVEPLIMIVLGVLIGGLVIGMYLPVFKLGSAL